MLDQLTIVYQAVSAAGLLLVIAVLMLAYLVLRK